MRLSSCLCFSSSETLPEEDHDHGLIRLVMDFAKPTGSWTGKNKRKMKQNEGQYQKLKMVKKGTLEDLLLAEAGRNENCICTSTGKECRFFIRFFKRICPPFSKDYAHTKASKAKFASASMERLLKVEVVDHNGETDVSSVSRSQSGNIRKRVSFRVPSEADIIIFYASDVDSEN